MLVLGLEGTAWCASAAVYHTETDTVLQESDAYVPDSGGIHPREAAEHVADAIPTVVGRVLDRLAEREWTADAGSGEGTAPPIDAVAFSRGPGLGPCLRAVGTAARTLAGRWDVPLVGVNHMVAHLEIGRHQSGFDSPVCLNASGANAHLLGYRDGRYRVLGETMDTGVGNAIDKFTRHVGWSHPGGPKVEQAATDGSYVDLPYVVKGMDFSFSGIMSAAKAEYDDGTPVEDVCYSLQETVFAMLTEVSERALSLTGSDELVLGGGVGQNARLREMLAEMCDARGAGFSVPEPRFLRDNAGMIAVLGAKMYRAGDTIPIAESSVDPNFRPDQVPVTWRSREESVAVVDPETRLRGAEAIVEIEGDRVVKRRVGKSYRHPKLDETLRTTRTRSEARLTSDARRVGVPTPLVYDVDVPEATLTLQFVGDADLAERLDPERCRQVGEHLARLHGAGFVHGDPTPRNVRVDDERTYLIDFGLGYYTDHVEDYAMDLHVFEGSVAGTASDASVHLEAFEGGYLDGGEQRVIDRLRTVEGRGRYQVDEEP
ncbi:bifunctional N(6)-L-threonylcarbamoyladenine synthase/serine/threonine protein kinase [Halalkaliarchaeum sp. AArc-CO]|uniref:bifunctional N(6)-L-threonylcarbamoyladenine synthase/serine/threonine protein kinase n=1 Tax=unclassified Halalkaliarchaeum TaxID=2678344 RepID=UPI00217CFB42|nr:MULTISPECIES: bifunctional N(6)-L-threonylcarbamoyladenine synthase/serine/threonine protein kinase [unclassified Halalkaliarchaeum]MDR5671636.1 bifunctional N(6)-L-threonylcarbamoyladenine synthase/serine/threonine protein kinase [Halalkaliarchaeum sp. AArc-GB]UWG51137.1 bifunctional N(6)-L-threonylcarbamoyladenine synthase/serine/threonine protein kinase [Halalkaliarchaeum sp. AArc-CO]